MAAAAVPPPVDLTEARSDPKRTQAVFHDWEAGHYDDKWSISFDERCTRYARERFAHVAGLPDEPYERSLEIGGGTGFFTLNLANAGVLRSGVVTDISPGMVEQVERTARALGHDVTAQVADAERLPFDDDSFDLVLGHAVLHHLPDVDAALREAVRVLRPGGRLVVAGEPTRIGDRVARRLSQATWEVTTRVLRVPPLQRFSRPAAELEADSAAAALEWEVDLHTFDPREVERRALAAGLVDVRVVTEELLAAWLGWPVRTFEHAVSRHRLGPRWARGAYAAWRWAMTVDETVLRHIVPGRFFYDVLLTGVAPPPPARLDP